MDNSTDIWMPLYTGDFLKNTRDFTAEECGAYILLLVDCWLRGGSCSSDPKTLKLITKCSAKKLQKVLAHFVEKDGRFYHEHIQRERIKAEENKFKKQQQTMAATKARWTKTDSVTESVTDNVTDSSLPSSSRSSLQLPSSLSTKEEPDGFAEFWDSYPATATSRKEAIPAFYRAVSLGAKPEMITQGAKEYKRKVKMGEIRNIYNPSTWLNEERWKFNKNNFL